MSNIYQYYPEFQDKDFYKKIYSKKEFNIYKIVIKHFPADFTALIEWIKRSHHRTAALMTKVFARNKWLT